ncbi:MAG TPA: hypothetical protein VFO69_03110 [Allosphingosinicella sp.]|nr:hypothetical protein [Allosphingosinicella sp.]
MSRPRPGAALALAALLLTAACGQPAAPPVANEAAASTLEPATNPASAEPAEAPKAAAMVLTPEGYGPLRIGMSLADVVTALGPDSDPDSVGGAEPEVCDQFRPVRAPEGLLVMVEEGRLTRISLMRGAEVATDRSLRVGASAAEVRAAYGSLVRAGPHKYQDAPAEYLTVWTRGGAGDEAIAPPDSRGLRYEIGQDGKVASIHAGGPSIQYVEGCL